VAIEAERANAPVGAPIVNRDSVRPPLSVPNLDILLKRINI
jgi:hypothetical protein